MGKQLKALQDNFLRRGFRKEAAKVRDLIRFGAVNLGLDEASWRVEEELASIDCAVFYNPDGTSAVAYYNSGFDGRRPAEVLV